MVSRGHHTDRVAGRVGVVLVVEIQMHADMLADMGVSYFVA